jgi:hypothetical protein
MLFSTWGFTPQFSINSMVTLPVCSEKVKDSSVGAEELLKLELLELKEELLLASRLLEEVIIEDELNAEELETGSDELDAGAAELDTSELLGSIIALEEFATPPPLQAIMALEKLNSKAYRDHKTKYFRFEPIVNFPVNYYLLNDYVIFNAISVLSLLDLMELNMPVVGDTSFDK